MTLVTVTDELRDDRRRAMREDNDRDLDLELAGFRVVRIEDTRIDEDPAGLAAAVLCLLRAAP